MRGMAARFQDLYRIMRIYHGSIVVEYEVHKSYDIFSRYVVVRVPEGLIAFCPFLISWVLRSSEPRREFVHWISPLFPRGNLGYS